MYTGEFKKKKKHPYKWKPTTIMIVFTSSGAENTSEINIPLESKYWYLENSLKEEKIKKKFKKEALFNIVHIMLHLHTNHSTLTLHRLYITDSWDPQIQASCMKLEGSVSYQLWMFTTVPAFLMVLLLKTQIKQAERYLCLRSQAYPEVFEMTFKY